MQIKNMSYIIALAEAGTLSAAGKQLGISQPTLSVFLSNLEQELGIDLFLRDKKKLIPTPAGRIYLEAARRILATQEQTLQSIRQLTTAPPIEIRIGVTPLRGSEVASKIFARFSARYPNIRLRLQEGYMRNCAIWYKMEWLPALSAPALTRNRQILTISLSFGKRSLSLSRPSIRWRTAPKTPPWNSRRFHQRSCPTLPLSL